MVRLTAFLLGIFLSLNAFAQRTISGRVLNEVTGAPIPGSSVFITNTSKGTVSNANGYFELTDVPPGKHELVISSIGYETAVYPFTDAQLPLLLKVQLTIKVKELENVIVEPFVEEGWDKWGKTFTENFLGYTDNAARCTIKNEKAIRFRYFKKSNRLIAFSDEPLRIENKALGYNILYQLEDFELNFSERTSVFLGYSLYEEMAKDKKAWSRRREAAYNGSLMHFIRSLYKDSLGQNGFEVRRLVKIPNTEKERVKKIYRVVRSSYNTGGGIKIVEAGPTNLNRDSADYYAAILRQPDFTEIYGKDLLNADSLLIREDGNFKLLYFTDHLSVVYKKELEADAYVKAQLQMRKPGYQRSTLVLSDLNPVWIEKNGNYYNPRDMFFLGYWSWSDKIGDSLPLDYEPGNN